MHFSTHVVTALAIAAGTAHAGFSEEASEANAPGSSRIGSAPTTQKAETFVKPTESATTAKPTIIAKPATTAKPSTTLYQPIWEPSVVVVETSATVSEPCPSCTHAPTTTAPIYSSASQPHYGTPSSVSEPQHPASSVRHPGPAASHSTSTSTFNSVGPTAPAPTHPIPATSTPAAVHPTVTQPSVPFSVIGSTGAPTHPPPVPPSTPRIPIPLSTGSVSSSTHRFSNSTTSTLSRATSGSNGGGGGVVPAAPTVTGFEPSSSGVRMIVPGLAVIGGIAMGLLVLA
ncbi:hypothetical protein BO70DRAFT_393644 [Aspergillus heteromorphus CBS 117.55]|uniref:Uncharacterized protein n=1 Tax=Aspergillus heteromorphus CBS 117.55 TaxID=1448321 RepID=A0A317WRP9_9EURO|nr:uncharacterized protein BO70DRAFT_393644 [Aspergillus heteromorphus CBS 117.55]PWY89133.1 hypothetical protein BO70DRAFT_393644 [Aspergillus heteromorphus CBS 117.55]